VDGIVGGCPHAKSLQRPKKDVMTAGQTWRNQSPVLALLGARGRDASTGHGGRGNRRVFPVSQSGQRNGSRALIPPVPASTAS